MLNRISSGQSQALYARRDPVKRRRHYHSSGIARDLERERAKLATVERHVDADRDAFIELLLQRDIQEFIVEDIRAFHAAHRAAELVDDVPGAVQKLRDLIKDECICGCGNGCDR